MSPNSSVPPSSETNLSSLKLMEEGNYFHAFCRLIYGILYALTGQRGKV